MQFGLFYLMSLNAWKQFGPSSRFQIGPLCTTLLCHERKTLNTFLKTNFFQLWPLKCCTSVQNWAFQIIFFHIIPCSHLFAMPWKSRNHIFRLCAWFFRLHHKFWNSFREILKNLKIKIWMNKRIFSDNFLLFEKL